MSAGKLRLAAIPQINSTSLSWPLILLVGLTLLRGLLYLSIFPPFLAPDESAHFEAIRLIGQERKWPTATVYSVTPMHPDMAATFEKFRIWSLVDLYSPTRNLGVASNLFVDYYPTQIAAGEVVANSYLMLYHLILAPLSAATASFDLVTQVYLLRLVSVLFAMGTLVMAWFTVRSIFPAEPALALAVGAFITFWPMHTHVDASIAVDPLAELIASAFFLVLVTIYLKGFSRVRAILLLALLTLAVLTKPTLFFLFPTLAVALIIFFSRRLKWPTRVIGGVLALLFMLTLVGSIVLYENSVGGRKLLSIFSFNLLLPNWSSFVAVEAVPLYLQSLNFAVVSFAGLFGWSNIHVSWAWVRFWAILLFLIILGSLIFIYQQVLTPGQQRYELSSLQRKILVIFIFALIFSFIGAVVPIIATQSPTWGIHSRYYFPVVIPLALYLFFGFRQLFPFRFRHLALPVWAMGWFIYDSLVLLLVILPYLFS
ncbi:MAG: hypothetical protein BroJett011_37840 [Chloroflexota bacterium]|nr:MAG: hypothetical protein BroJett011_37840 [Chloroflexota bacterium]